MPKTDQYIVFLITHRYSCIHFGKRKEHKKRTCSSASLPPSKPNSGKKKNALKKNL